MSQSIGIFDSGVGGFTVLRELVREFPGESFIYLGDTARLPYGSKSPQTIAKYLIQNVEFLERQGVKAVVVACNSASSVLAEVPEFSIPLYGVIQPGARFACDVTRSKRVGVMGTTATVSGNAYEKAIRAILADVFVLQQECPLLVPLVEEGWDHESVTLDVLHRYLTPLKKAEVDTLVLGCTHYPVLRKAIEAFMGPNVTVVDSAQAIARDLRQDLEAGHVPISQRSQGEVHVLLTDDSPTFRRVSKKLMEGIEMASVDVVSVTEEKADAIEQGAGEQAPL